MLIFAFSQAAMMRRWIGRARGVLTRPTALYGAPRRITIEFTGCGRAPFKHRRVKLVEKARCPEPRCNELLGAICCLVLAAMRCELQPAAICHFA